MKHPYDKCAKCGHARRDHAGMFKSCAWRGNYGRWLCFTTAQACFCRKFRESTPTQEGEGE